MAHLFTDRETFRTIDVMRLLYVLTAIGAFHMAYGGFMWAFIVCQDTRWWTVMVWLYQFTQNAEPFLTTAALTVASVPTLIVYVLGQRVILRGVMLPTMD